MTMYAERESATFPWWIVLLEGIFAVIFERKQEPAEAAAPAANSAPEPGYMAELEWLAQLRDQGILSEEEFEAKKKQVLG